MKTFSVYIAEDNDIILKQLLQALEAYPSFKLSGSASDGLEGFLEIVEKKPDIIILDIIMPTLDGIEILNKIHCLKKDGYHPNIFVISSINNDQVTRMLFTMGISFFMLKPFNSDVLIHRIHTIMNENAFVSNNAHPDLNNQPISMMSIKDDHYEKLAEKVLLNIGAPCKCVGFLYLRYALVECLKNENNIYQLTNTLYRNIASVYGESTSAIERALRTVIQKAWRNRKKTNDPNFYQYFSASEKQPSNGEFLAKLTYHVKTTFDTNLLATHMNIGMVE